MLGVFYHSSHFPAYFAEFQRWHHNQPAFEHGGFKGRTLCTSNLTYPYRNVTRGQIRGARGTWDFPFKEIRWPGKSSYKISRAVGPWRHIVETRRLLRRVPRHTFPFQGAKSSPVFHNNKRSHGNSLSSGFKK